MKRSVVPSLSSSPTLGALDEGEENDVGGRSSHIDFDNFVNKEKGPGNQRRKIQNRKNQRAHSESQHFA